MKKALLVVLALVLVAALSVGLTMAYLTSQDTVTNTFTVGKVEITLDEAKVTEYGVKVDGASRVDKNTYKLIPGHTYVKDPTVHVTEGSEPCYVFVKVENSISAVTENIVMAAGWTGLSGETGVYYKTWAPGDDTDLVVFSEFKVKNDAILTGVTNADAITVTAYAVQADTFTDAADAWEKAGF